MIARAELNHAQQLSASLRLCGGLGLLEFRFTFFIHEQAPDAAEKTINAFDAFGVPGLHHLQRAHEHFVKAKCVRAVFCQDVIRVDDVAARLGHLLAVFAEDQSLVDEFEKRLRRRDVAEIEQNLVPETRVEQVQHGVLGAADVEINSGRRR